MMLTLGLPGRGALSLPKEGIFRENPSKGQKSRDQIKTQSCSNEAWIHGAM